MAVGNDDDKNLNLTRVDDTTKKTDPFDSLSEEEKARAVQLLESEKKGEIKTLGQTIAEKNELEQKIYALEKQQQAELNQKVQLVGKLQSLNNEFELAIDFSELDIDKLKREVAQKIMEKAGINYTLNEPTIEKDIENLANILRQKWIKEQRDSLSGRSNSISSGIEVTDILMD